jgi:hypothetical protein
VRRLALAAFSAAVFLAARPACSDSRPAQVEVNRPRSIFECDTPVGEKWYGSKGRCLKDLCAGQNVISTHVFDGEGRLRRNPCYGRSPFELQK